MTNLPAYFYLYAHNIAVKGRARSVIYDLQHQRLVPIPTILHTILGDLKQQPWCSVQQKYAPHDPAVFDKYLAFLQEKDLGLFVSSLAPFPPLALAWHSPYPVQNAVVSYTFGQYALPDVLAQLEALHCRHLELHLTTHGQSWADIAAVLRPLASTGFQSVTVLLTYAPAVADEQQLRLLYEQHPKIQCLVVHGAPAYRRSSSHPDSIVWVPQDLRQARPGNRYVVTVEYFTEALRFNPYYNRKICVDELGTIKNCLLHTAGFGNVATTRLAAALASPEFQELWHAAPDQTADIRESELRYALFCADDLRRDTATGLFSRTAHLDKQLSAGSGRRSEPGVIEAQFCPPVAR